MNSDVEFQIVCTDCGCLAIRIEDPLTASREAVVYCGDCGASRGTVGALRDLALQPNAEVMMTTKSRISNHPTADDPDLASGLSKKYDELRRLRREVEILCGSNRRQTRDGRFITPITPQLDAAKSRKTRTHKSNT
jgi:hypothetical protein